MRYPCLSNRKDLVITASPLHVPYSILILDYYISITLIDPNYELTRQSLTVNVFSKTIDLLPKNLRSGNIVKIKKVKIQSFQGTLQGISSKGFEAWIYSPTEASWHKFPGNVSSPVAFFEALKISKFNQFDVPKASDGISFSKKLLQSNEISAGVYFNFVGEVVKIIQEDANDRNECFSIIFTDYTSNSMFRLIDIPELSLFSSDICLFVTFWDNHIAAASGLRVGQTVLLRNLHARLIQPMQNLVAVLHGTREMHVDPCIRSLLSDEPAALDLSKYVLGYIFGSSTLTYFSHRRKSLFMQKLLVQNLAPSLTIGPSLTGFYFLFSRGFL